MDKNLLVRLFGFPATLIHGDTLVLDRWLWLRRRLPETANGESLLDVGCGAGAFTIGAARRGYVAHGLSWDERNQSEAAKRASICGAPLASFGICDVRELDKRDEYKGAFDVAISAENIEHVLDDARLIKSIAGCLKPGGRLLLTTPNYYYRAITTSDNGPFCKAESGWHVRRGYTRSMLLELIKHAGLECEEVSYCSGFASQKVTRLMRKGTSIHLLFGWGIVLPLRAFVPVVDALISRWSRTPPYSICLEAYKPRLIPRTALTSL
jgi:SAM-dependent methyltransferase